MLTITAASNSFKLTTLCTQPYALASCRVTGADRSSLW